MLLTEDSKDKKDSQLKIKTIKGKLKWLAFSGSTRHILAQVTMGL